MNPLERKPFRILGLVDVRLIIAGRMEVKSINKFFLFETSANLPSLMSSSNFLAITRVAVWGWKQLF